jgi:hypothetical protein
MYFLRGIERRGEKITLPLCHALDSGIAPLSQGGRQ